VRQDGDNKAEPINQQVIIGSDDAIIPEEDQELQQDVDDKAEPINQQVIIGPMMKACPKKLRNRNRTVTIRQSR
jgi:hypothetical protein